MSSLSNLTIHSIGGGWGKDVEDEGLELVAVIRGTDIPNLEINNIQGVPFRYETQKKIQSRLLQIGDLVIEISGGSASSKQRTGRCLYITDELLKNLGGKVIPASFCKLLRLDRKKVNSKYVYYQIKAMHLSDEIASFENQSTGISNFQFNRFIDEIRPSILDIEVQNKIVNFLEKIDLKIINNININQTLEQIAQTIFKSWFIDFDPVHAKANALASGQAAEQATQAAMAVISGKNTQELHRLQTANPEQYQQLWEIAEAFPSGVDEEGLPWGWIRGNIGAITKAKRLKVGCVDAIVLSAVSSSELIRSDELFTKQVYSKSIEKYLQVHLWDFAYNPSRINIGSIGLLKENIIGAVSPVYEVFSVKEKYHWFLEKILSLEYTKKYIQTLASGSVRQSLKLSELQTIPCVIPNEFIMDLFNSYYISFLDYITNNEKQNTTLSNIRDELLPKLLSGEV